MKSEIHPRDLLVGLLLVQSSLERRGEALFQPFGLTGAQFNILNVLADSEGRKDQAAVVDLLLVGKSSVSIVLNRMVRNGLVEREKHPRDRRQVVLILTPKGRALWRKASRLYEASVDKVFGALPASRRRHFIDDLKLIHGVLLDEDAESGDRWHSHISRTGGAK